MIAKKCLSLKHPEHKRLYPKNGGCYERKKSITQSYAHHHGPCAYDRSDHRTGNYINKDHIKQA